ncbi:carbohydrate ABC transporter permease [Thermosporothrix hazakensis]|uniref:carbohydrate ABC transporter permease n=1 Tax=Thermosporothrix hazakensis TaxID=644383 RepID=UPI001FE45A3B|nr:carbohydrate ABC transporter permease [Thermosporothrix hazakensis]
MILSYAVVLIAALCSVFPLYYIFVTSLLTNRSAFDVVPHILPDWEWMNYVRAWTQAPWGRYFLNSIIVVICSILLTLTTTLLAGYAFGTMKFKGRKVLFMLILALIMIPSEAMLIPNYLIVSALNWMDTYQAQFVPFGVSISGIFLLRQFFLSLPPSLWEAAQIDGCTRFGFLWRVAAPLARPALVVIALQVFIASWNSFLWPYLVTNSDLFRPVEVGLRSFITAEGTDPTGLAAAASFTTLPILVIFLIAQKQFIEGISAGSVKG